MTLAVLTLLHRSTQRQHLIETARRLFELSSRLLRNKAKKENELNVAVSPSDRTSLEVGNAARKIVHRTRGDREGPITRLMSPEDLGEVFKPFVFLDLFEVAAFAGRDSHHIFFIPASRRSPRFWPEV